jgi:Na+-transporting methylmalonyl-CoA/oxaloacetate decarboxylase gamma subunit
MALWIIDPGPSEGMVYLFLFIIALFIVYLIARVLSNSSVAKKQAEADVEKEKLKIIREDMAEKALPFTRLSGEQVTALRAIDQDNEVLTTDIYAKRKEVEGRLQRLENYITQAKLDNMLVKIGHEEKKRR